MVLFLNSIARSLWIYSDDKKMNVLHYKSLVVKRLEHSNTAYIDRLSHTRPPVNGKYHCYGENISGKAVPVLSLEFH